ncbi:hypothetical protein C8R47DRAFT_1198561 [Mycena vitilis]|nr:hypothetical protein C8R47DRAFT_1198561 [Mycena vitilis]
MTANPGSDLHKVGPLWLSAEAVILRAQDRIFRVFVAILKEKSSVFADMFAFPQPPSSDTETMDGVPVVTLHDDPVELEVFLKAIFGVCASPTLSQSPSVLTFLWSFRFFMPPPAENKLADTIGILRLAHKYGVPYLRRRALQHLVAVYHTRLSMTPAPLMALPKLRFLTSVWRRLRQQPRSVRFGSFRWRSMTRVHGSFP